MRNFHAMVLLYFTIEGRTDLPGLVGGYSIAKSRTALFLPVCTHAVLLASRLTVDAETRNE